MGRWITLVFVLIAVILTGAWLVTTRMPYPRERGRVALDGLSASVEIYRDRDGVPHLFAETTNDLYFAQGYVHAQDRFWQMEISRRIGRGRLSALFGKTQKSTDTFLRTFGYARAADRAYEQLDDKTREYLASYAAGVNAYIGGRRPSRVALGFTILRLTGVKVEIEEWSPTDTIVWAKVMAANLDANMGVERLQLDLIRSVGLKGKAGQYAPYRGDMPLTVSKEDMPGLLERVFPFFPRDVDDLPRPQFVVAREDSIGSNAFAISGSRTATGKPLLASDLHLGIQLPSIWYEIALHCEDCPLEVRGFSLPGSPGVIIGHNDRIAWGITDFGDDVQDLYLERLNPQNPDQYLTPNGWKDTEILYEEIEIEGEDQPYILRVRLTDHGPIISDQGAYAQLAGFWLEPNRGNGTAGLELTALSLRWAAHDGGRILRAVLRVNEAGDFGEFREALRDWHAPAVTMPYADVDGNIGFQLVGRLPIRRRSDGMIPVPGWTGEHDWDGFYDFDALPWVLNPESGYLVTANNPVVGPEYPIPIGTHYTYGYRARRITDLLEADIDGISMDDAALIQADVHDAAALEIIPYLRNLDLVKAIEDDLKDREIKSKRPWDTKKRNKQTRRMKKELAALEEARDLLLQWDGTTDEQSAAGALYGHFWLALTEEAFRDQYPENRWPPGGQERISNALHYLLEEPGDDWWDDRTTPDERETRDEILFKALRNGRNELVKKQGKRIRRWEWGKEHTATFREATFGSSGIGPIERLYNRGPFPLGGGGTHVNVASWRLKEPFEVGSVPTLRQIVDMSDPIEAWLMHAPGQSAHPTHRHYDDLIEEWRDVEFHTSGWTRDQVRRRSRRLVLTPTD